MFKRTRRRRRGTSTVQWALIAAVVLLVVIASVKFLGQESNERLDQTSVGAGDPSQLIDMVDR